jgi:probable rRNA maturation factor
VTVTVDLQIAYDGQVPDRTLFQQWVEAAFKEDVTEDCELSIRLVEVTESAELNQTYRAKSGPTNVLSFPFDAPIPMEPILLGDLVICVPIVEREAQEQVKQLEHHWAHLVVHGCLHLLGYDHIENDQAEGMEAFEIEILQTLAIDNPYLEQGETA